MDENLFVEVLSVVKYFRNKPLILRVIGSMELTDDQREMVMPTDPPDAVVRHVQSHGHLIGSYGIEYAPTVYGAVMRNLLNGHNVIDCLAVSVENDMRMFKIAALYMLYHESGDVKYAIAGVKLARKYEYRRYALYGLTLLEERHCGVERKMIKELKERDSKGMIGAVNVELR